MFDISVVIPTYEADAQLVAAVNSIIDCETLRIQIVVVEDGSPKPSEVLLRKNFLELFGADSPKQRVSIRYLYQENAGAYLARIVGAQNSDGLYLKFLDQDDTLIPGSLNVEFNAFSQDVDAVLSNWLVAALTKDEHGQDELNKAPNLANPIDDFLQYGGVFTSAALYRTNLVKKALKPVASFKPVKADDWLIFAQICLAGATYKTIDNTAYVWNQSEHQLSRSTRDRLVREHFDILNWIENELDKSSRLTPPRKCLLANYYAKQLLESYTQNRDVYGNLIGKIRYLNPNYRQLHGNRLYRVLCDRLGLDRGVQYYSLIKSVFN